MFFCNNNSKHCAIARAAADDNGKASAVFISGATGSDAAKVNGLFEPTAI
jgi:hypothetical protein